MGAVTKNNDSKILELESIRGIAAVLVAVYHIPGWNSNLYDIGFLRNGYLMVQLFFVLSGFVIYRTYAAKLNTLRDLAKFQFLRFGRLYPVHLVVLLVFLGIETAKFAAVKYLSVHSPNSSPFVENSGEALIQQLFLIQALGPTGNAETFNGPAWSISVEFYTYMIFGLIVLFAKRAHLAVMATIASISCYLLVNNQAAGFAPILLCFTGFFSGCLTAFLASRHRYVLPRHSVLLTLVCLIFYLQFKPHGSFDLLIFPITALLILAVVNGGEEITKRVLRTKFLAWLGLISYSVYMTHLAVLWLFIQVHRVILKRPETLVTGKSVPQLSVIEAGVTYVVAIFLIMVVSALTYRYIEAPCRRKSRAIASAPAAPAN
jgi:peptidoglycan/LPS O-acetylase OafA/YrhL